MSAEIQLAKKKTNFDKSKYDDAIRFIHENSGISPEDLKNKSARELINETTRILSESISQSLQSGLKYEVPETLTTALRENVFRFSGMKTYHELKEASQLLLTDKGEIKSFQKFKEDVEKIHSKYNERYLEVEYDFAVHSAQMAVKWNEYEQDGDEYDLQYRTSGDDKVRADHAALHGTTLPLSDPFWNAYLPPLDWGCRCTTVQVLKEKYPASNSAEAQELGKKATTRMGADGTNKLAMFRFNPGKEMKIYPDKHPYMARSSSPLEVKQAQKVVEGLAEKSATKLLYKELIGNTIQTEISEHNSIGIIKLNSYGLDNFLDRTHSRTYESKLVLKEVLNKKASIGNPEFEPLNLNRKNINKKIKKGWEGVNKYTIDAFGKKWEMKTAIIHNRYEVPYCIKRIP